MVRVITDTDLCNEADDPFAVVQALLSPKFDNVGVVAAHFGTRDPNGMQKSWQGLKDLTVLMQLTVPVLHGAPHALPDAATPVPSEGAKLIIREAMKEDTRPLFVLLLGPLTDLASAYLQEPRIAGRLTAIWIGGAGVAGAQKCVRDDAGQYGGTGIPCAPPGSRGPLPV